MSHFTYEELLNAPRGQAVTAASPFEAARLWTDTRTLQPGDFFLPLSGERFDGHDYLEQAFASGAVGAFVKQEKVQQHPEWQRFPNLLAVEEPVQAYLDMARLHREKINPIVIAVTGSSGKTTSKEMLAAAFSPLRKTVKTEKNFNNEVGVSQTLLALQPGTEILIVEMGMRGLRQISILSEAAKPDVALIVNVGPAHIGLLGSLENIAKAKLEIAEGMEPAKGQLVLCGDSKPLAELAPQLWPGKQIAYHLSEAEDLQIWMQDGHTGVRFTYQETPIFLPVVGDHMVSNALGVLKVGEALGFSPAELARGLAQFVPEAGRGERTALRGYQNAWTVNDAYNANPDSTIASLKAFLSLPCDGLNRVLVLGGMKELGNFSQAYHEELGQWLAKQAGIAQLVTIGEEGHWMADSARTAAYPIFAADTVQDAIDHLSRHSLDNTILYLKGSRAYRLDEIPQALAAARMTNVQMGEAL
ncbi:MAG TPA: UDP-N-acetylmuramoyl-tripeptide--D-alanyl-D-alanine ligase [Oculatellaceae cyanobacterium]